MTKVTTKHKYAYSFFQFVIGYGVMSANSSDSNLCHNVDGNNQSLIAWQPCAGSTWLILSVRTDEQKALLFFIYIFYILIFKPLNIFTGNHDKNTDN